MPDALVISTLARYLVRAIKSGAMTRDDVNAISVNALAKMQAGVTIISSTFEGGGATSVINSSPADLMAAAELALDQTDPDCPGALSGNIVQEDLSRTRIET